MSVSMVLLLHLAMSDGFTDPVDRPNTVSVEQLASPVVQSQADAPEKRTADSDSASKKMVQNEHANDAAQKTTSL
jgi:hypothetical protein